MCAQQNALVPDMSDGRARQVESARHFAESRDADLRGLARHVLTLVDRKGLRMATAESCTGGLLSTILTDIPGLSHRFECGFVVYSEAAKTQLLGVPRDLIKEQGAVSKHVAVEMARRALDRSKADLAISITGFAGPGGCGDEEGLVHIGVASTHCPVWHAEFHFGAIGRDAIRARTLEECLLFAGRYIPLL